MNSDYLRVALNGFDKVVMPAIEAGCSRKDVAAARVVRANLADVLVNLVEWERTAGPDALARMPEPPANVVRFSPYAMQGRASAGADHGVDGGDAA